MSKFLVCNHLFPNVQYETNIFVVKMIQIWDYYIWIIRFMCANWGQIDILGKIITGQNLRFSVRGPFMFEIQTYWIISVSIFEQYIFEIHRLCIESANTEISKCILTHLINFLSLFSDLAHPCTGWQLTCAESLALVLNVLPLYSICPWASLEMSWCQCYLTYFLRCR